MPYRFRLSSLANSAEARFGKLSRRLRLVSFLADSPWVCCDALAPNPMGNALAPLQVGEDELYR
jgi:hypothetical protein